MNQQNMIDPGQLPLGIPAAGLIDQQPSSFALDITHIYALLNLPPCPHHHPPSVLQELLDVTHGQIFPDVKYFHPTCGLMQSSPCLTKAILLKMATDIIAE